jgi:amphi-Trp domain-containing protein
MPRPARPVTDRTRVLSRARFVATLRRIAGAIEAGRPVRLQVAGERVVVPREAEPSVEHEREGDREEIELQLRWRR